MHIHSTALRFRLRNALFKLHYHPTRTCRSPYLSHTFAKVPPLGNLPGIVPARASVSNVSSNRVVQESVDLSDGCLVTKSLKYAHQLAHWINALHTGEPPEVVSGMLTSSYQMRMLIPFSLKRHFCRRTCISESFPEAALRTPYSTIHTISLFVSPKFFFRKR